MKVLDDPVPKPGGGDPYICMVVEYMVNMTWFIITYDSGLHTN